jgi:hypothetical protein
MARLKTEVAELKRFCIFLRRLADFASTENREASDGKGQTTAAVQAGHDIYDYRSDGERR